MIDKIIELFDKGYCNECNELNCLGGEPSSKTVANAIRKLKQENTNLKQALIDIREIININEELSKEFWLIKLIPKKVKEDILQIIQEAIGDDER